jgi:hypothetical protein
VRSVTTEAYSPAEFGLLKARRRLTRVQFWQSRRPRRVPLEGADERQLRQLLPEVYAQLARLSVLPLGLEPEKIRAEWDDDERVFVLRPGGTQHGLTGFCVHVIVDTAQDGTGDATDPSGVVSEVTGP